MSQNAMPAGAWLFAIAGLALGGALLTSGLIWILRPWLIRYALARPSARGLHTIPTPQGGGIAVLAGAAVVAFAAAWMVGLDATGSRHLTLVFGAAAGLALVGFVDDIRPLPALPRLLLQLVLMAVGVASLPEGTRVLPFLPVAVETVLLVVGGTWFVNLTNFMDGMDGITVADLAPLLAMLVLFWIAGDLPPAPGCLALGVLAGLLGFAPFNRPVAKLFLGDVGSLPLGFLVAIGLYSLAGQDAGHLPGALVAAVLLPLYPIVDSGWTLVRRLLAGQRIWEPHRSHFYQQAIANGRRIEGVLVRIAAANVVFGVLAWLSLGQRASVAALALGSGVVLVGLLLRWLSHRTQP